MSFQNSAARKRRKLAKKLTEHINELKLTDKEISKGTGVDLITVRGLRELTPKLETLEKISQYVERVARLRRLKETLRRQAEAQRKKKPASSRKRKKKSTKPSS